MESLLLQELDSSRISLFDNKNSFWIRAYKYYYSGGYKYIFTNNVVKLLISYILIFIINFLINCIDYQKLLYLEGEDNKIGNFVDLHKWFPTNIYLIICFFIYSIYLVCITLDCIISIISYRNFRTLLNDFYEIHDDKIKYVNWEELVKIITLKNEEHHELLSSDSLNINLINLYDENIYNINSIICRQNNVIVSIFRSRIFTMPRISKLLEWNFIYCIVDPLMNLKKKEEAPNSSYGGTDNEGSIIDVGLSSNRDMSESSVISEEEEDEEEEIDLLDTENSTLIRNTELNNNDFNDKIKKQLVKSVNNRINLVIIINLVALPFALLILTIYITLKYGEQFYHTPKLIYERQLDLRTKWQLKYYNEVPDLFDERVKNIENNMNKIINQYKYSILQIIYRLIVFVLGSIFIILFMFTMIGGNQFANIILCVCSDKNIKSVRDRFFIIIRSRIPCSLDHLG